RVGALQYEIAEVRVPPDLKEPLVVVLQPAGGIEVRLRTQPGTPADAVRVRITAETGEIFVGKMDSGDDRISFAAGATESQGGAWGGDHSEFSYLPDAGGRVVIAGVRPRIPVTVSAVDRSERIVLATSVLTLQPAEWRTVDLEVAGTPWTLRGTVRGPGRKPIAR